MASKPLLRLGAGLAGIAGFVGVGSACIFNVEPGYRGIMFDQIRGVLPQQYDEGTHFKIPFIQTPIYFDVRVQPRLIANNRTPTKDLQMVNISVRVLSHPDYQSAALSRIYQNIGVETDYDERILPSLCNEVIKSVIAQYNADQLLIQREKVSLQIKEGITERAKEFDIKLDDVAMTQLSFSKEFARAIEAKQCAQQFA